MIPSILLTGVLSLIAGGAGTFAFFKLNERKRREQAEAEVAQWRDQARREAETERSRLLVEAQTAALQAKTEANREVTQTRQSLADREQTLARREDAVQRKEETLQKQERGLESSQTRLTTQLQGVASQREKLEQTLQEQQQTLQQASGMSREEATQRLLESLANDLQEQRGSMLIRHQKTLEESINAQAREMLLTAIQRFASVNTTDNTTSSVDVPTDDIKGRIIGREGRNIRAFEKTTGIDLIIDDTPGVVICSGFDPVRREIAKQSLESLIADGRIHPSRIEEVVKETTKKMEEVIIQKGREAADEVGVPGLHPKIIQALGRLHFRTSYSQNVLRHSIEVAFFAGLIAEMLGMDGDLARRCGLLHDIGKAADHELEGGHPKIGADLLRRHKESPEVVHAALGHHDEIVTEHPYTMLAAIGDACSASRPGARRESLERYVKRMEELETIAGRFDGVRQAYAISAGRELRVIVSSEQTTDESAALICHEITQAFEAELTYPGEIKVTVVRESHFTGTAK